MPRYIDADALVEKINSNACETWYKGLGNGWWTHSVKLKDNIVNLIKNEPAAEVEPVRTAHWVIVQTTNPTVSTVHRCSNPDCRLTTYARRLPPYCQECGSKMLGEVREDDDKYLLQKT